MEHYTLANGVTIPKIGFGTWQIPDGEVAYEAVKSAIELGYTHIDTAQIYGNEASVGRAIADSQVPRQNLFITTKVWNDKTDAETARQSVLDSLEKMGLDYLDLVLIHWPNPKPLQENEAWKTRNAGVWSALEDLYEAGKIRAIGVSNFMVHHLTTLLETARITPMVNQIYLAPGVTQNATVAFCQEHGILLEAYSPFGTGTLFGNPLLEEMAERYGKTVGQLALAWSLQKGFLPLPKSVTPANIAANLTAFGITLEPADLELLDKLEGNKPALDPDQATF